MTNFIGVVSQKGGVGKSTLARLIACEYASAGWSVKIADMDVSQATSFHWRSRRLRHGLTPDVPVEQFSRVEQVQKIAGNYDLIVFDGAPHSTAVTLQIAQPSTLVVLPTGISLDDLEPTVRLAHELKQKGIPPARLAFAFCRVGDSGAELEDAKAYITQTGYLLLQGTLPERTAYRRASDQGRTPTETGFNTLNERAGELMQSIVDRVKVLQTKEQRNHAKGKN